MLEDSGLGRALGQLSDVTVLLEAADIYVDSYPFSSLTSMLEAGAYGTPVISYQDRPPSCAVLGADTPELNDEMVIVTSLAEFHREMAKLINSEDARSRLGARTAAAIEASHRANTWAEALDELYARVPRVKRIQTRVSAPEVGELDQMVQLVQSQTGLAQGKDGAALVNIHLLPLSARVSLLWRTFRAGRKTRATQLLSTRSLRRLRSLWDRLQRRHGQRNSSTI